MIDAGEEILTKDPSQFVEKPGRKVTKRPDHATRAIPTKRHEDKEPELIARERKKQEDATARRIIDEALADHAIGDTDKVIEPLDTANREPISYTSPAPVEPAIKPLEGAELEEAKRGDSFWRKVWNFGQNRFGR